MKKLIIAIAVIAVISVFSLITSESIAGISYYKCWYGGEKCYCDEDLKICQKNYEKCVAASNVNEKQAAAYSCKNVKKRLDSIEKQLKGYDNGDVDPFQDAQDAQGDREIDYY